MTYRIICLLLVGCLAVWTGGCSKKSVGSDGRTSSASRAPMEPIPDLSMADPAGTERLSSGIAVAKNDPATARRQMEELRAEQAATAAAGLRDVFFGYDSWTISDEGRQVLSRNAEWLRSHPAVQLKVEGHC
ncbi:MAG TPA: hypothetical protein VJR03_11465, partial [Nitrospira sp.]|nr:hypothetical protein [Nitrospira sp.]